VGTAGKTITTENVEPCTEKLAQQVENLLFFYFLDKANKLGKIFHFVVVIFVGGRFSNVTSSRNT